jgi:hypothetical protein
MLCCNIGRFVVHSSFTESNNLSIQHTQRYTVIRFKLNSGTFSTSLRSWILCHVKFTSSAKKLCICCPRVPFALTISIEQGPWEASSRSPSQDIPHVSWNPNDHKNSPLVPISRRMNAFPRPLHSISTKSISISPYNLRLGFASVSFLHISAQDSCRLCISVLPNVNLPQAPSIFLFYLSPA